MTVPITSYQIGTTQVQYTNQNMEKNNIPDPNMNNIDIPDPMFDIPDLGSIPNIDIPDPMFDVPDLNINKDQTKLSSNIDQNNNQEEIINNNIPDIQELAQNNILNSNSQLPPKYNIMDLFWLINPNYLENRKSNNNSAMKEAEFITISYNLDFGNLKVNLYNITPNAIKDNVVFLQSMTLLVSGTIYPASSFKLMNVLEYNKFTCIEQLITNTHEQWQSERPIVTLERREDGIVVTITNKKINRTFYYVFKNWQSKAFQSALKLTYTNGLNLRANILAHKGD